MNKGKESHLSWEEKSHAVKSGWSSIRGLKQECKQMKRGKEYENNGKVNGRTTIGKNDSTTGE